MIEIKKHMGEVLQQVDSDTLAGADLRGANLCDANLRGADLRGADLRDANLCGATYGANIPISKQPLIIDGMQWHIMLLDKHMKIGCQLHSFEDWFSFDDDFIHCMHNDALEFWATHKTVLFALAESTGRWTP